MIRSRFIAVLAGGLAMFAVCAVPAAAAGKERACFYYADSGWGLWATRNVSCTTAKRVYNDATKRVLSGRLDRTIRIDGYRCKMDFDGGGEGTCRASRQRRIRFAVP